MIKISEISVFINQNLQGWCLKPPFISKEDKQIIVWNLDYKLLAVGQRKFHWTPLFILNPPLKIEQIWLIFIYLEICG